MRNILPVSLSLLLLSVSSCKKEEQIVKNQSLTEFITRKNSGGSTGDLNKGIVAFYPFNGNAKDASTNRFDGIVFDATLATDRFGNSKKAYSFNGTSSYIYANGLNQSFFDNKDFSISLFVFFRNFNSDYPCLLWGENGYLIFQGVGGSNSPSSIGKIGFYINEINSPYPSQNGAVSSYSPISDNEWHNIIITKSGLTMTMYIDGNFSNSAPYYFTGKYLLSGSGMFFGNANASGFTFGFDGALDDIRIYNRALTQPEVIYLATH